MTQITKMQINPHTIGHDTPHGVLTVISPKRFTYLEGVEFLTKSRIKAHVNLWNPKMQKHWQIPEPTGVILPIRKKDYHPFLVEDSLVHGTYWGCGYRFECDWKNNKGPRELMKYGGIDISTNSTGLPKLDMGNEEEVLF